MKQETASGSGVSWAICKSAPRSRQITMPALHHSVFTNQMPFLLPNQHHQRTRDLRLPRDMFKKRLCISCVLVSSYSFRKFEGTFMYDYHTDCLFYGVQMYVTLKGTDGIGTSWDVSEAALYIMTAVAKDLSP